MAESPIRVFISYAREDEDFVRRLQGTLESRGIEPWVDRSRLEGGDEFDRRIEHAIHMTNCLLVVLTPDSVQSTWVLNEISFAQQLGKRVIPLMLRDTLVPVTIVRLHNIQFAIDYDEGLQELLVTLYHRVGNDEHSPGFVNGKQDQGIGLTTSGTGQIEKKPLALAAPDVQEPVPLPDLNVLYQAGLRAEKGGDLEQANVLWKEVLDRDPQFRDGFVHDEWEKLQTRLIDSRVKQLNQRADKAIQDEQWLDAVIALQELVRQEPQERANQAKLLDALRHHAFESHRKGHWTEAIESWQAIRDQSRVDAEVDRYLKDAEHNRIMEPLYEDAKVLLRENQRDWARQQLDKLYAMAPTFGDSEGIAAALGMTVAPTLVEQDRIAEEERNRRYILLQDESASLDKEIETVEKSESSLQSEISKVRSQRARIETDLAQVDADWKGRTFASLLVAKGASSFSALLNACFYSLLGLVTTLIGSGLILLIARLQGLGDQANGTSVVVLIIGTAGSILLGFSVGSAVQRGVRAYQRRRETLQDKLNGGNFTKRLGELEEKHLAIERRLRELRNRKKEVSQEIKQVSPLHKSIQGPDFLERWRRFRARIGLGNQRSKHESPKDQRVVRRGLLQNVAARLTGR